MQNDGRKAYIGEHVVELFKFVIRTEYLVLDPYTIEMGLDQT